MKKRTILTLTLLIAAGLAAAAQGSRAGSAAADPLREARLNSHVYYFASDSLRGRLAGSADAAKARAYIVGEYTEMGIEPLFGNSLEQPFRQDTVTYTNVIGVIRGSDPALKDEYIVLGAHYDHLGVRNGEIYNGADDNASGSATLIEVARELCERRGKLGRSVIIAAFDAEELGLYGSFNLSTQLKDMIAKGQIKLMVSMDMVGWYAQSGSLKMEGVGTIQNGRKIMNEESDKCGIKLKFKDFEDEVFTATDTEGFAEKGVPTLDVTTGLKSPYHKPQDDAELIDYKGLDLVTGFMTDVALRASTDPSFQSSGQRAEKHGGKAKVLDLGIYAGIGGGMVNFPKSAVTTKSGFSWNAGIQCNLNFNHLGIMSGVEYGSTVMAFPDESDFYGNRGKYSQSGITVPAMLVATASSRMTRAWLGAGGYWTHVFSSSISGPAQPYTTAANQYGWQWGFGFKVGHVTLSLNRRYQIGRLFTDTTAPDARMRGFTVNLGYLF